MEVIDGDGTRSGGWQGRGDGGRRGRGDGGSKAVVWRVEVSAVGGSGMRCDSDIVDGAHGRDSNSAGEAFPVIHVMKKIFHSLNTAETTQKRQSLGEYCFSCRPRGDLSWVWRTATKQEQ
ncbi:hypothetical protein PIB30_026864 [Stylosanthes scabra]|uniref:Uncharacterized protein n=1 Tax=Stylosanthes scabra TaxID=79078 RepID=A0ABU6SBB1_9FABA|nr:hypothetical protein [Stylosanthes scabra]